MLPEDFLERMRQMLGEEYPAFLASYEGKRHQALRINPHKADRDAFLAKQPFSLEPVPWEKNGFYYGGEDTPGKHPYHEAGVYYIQEPSAMAPAAYLMRDFQGAVQTERILDLCAAPGGKSTQIAAYMGGEGLLVCNEIHPARAKILSENVERMGICNALVTNETPQRLAEHFPSYFTRILVDAPCSGEGMFRKNEEACEEWSMDNVRLCAARQDEILDCAAVMLAPGGRLVYSTCTFSKEENEGSVTRFLQRHPEFFLEEVPLEEGMANGVPIWGEAAACDAEGRTGEAPFCAEELARTIRLWPHRLRGEGHFLAVLTKSDGKGCECPKVCVTNHVPLALGIPEKELRQPGKGILEYLQFVGEELTEETRNRLSDGAYLRFGDQLYRMPEGMPSLKGLKVLRPGLHLGTIKKNRFEPSHALALALRPEAVLHRADFSSDGSQIGAYLNGQTLSFEGEKGWYLVCVDGYSIGWGKLAGGMLKNHYPKGLRLNGR